MIGINEGSKAGPNGISFCVRHFFYFFGLKRQAALLLLVPLVVLLNGCSPKNAGAATKNNVREPVPVLVAEAVQKDFDLYLSAFGHVSSYNRVAVKPRVSGHIISVHFQEGQDLEQGELLFKIDPRKTEASLAQAQAALARDEARLSNATNNFARARALFEQSLISQEQMDSVTTELRTAEATVASDQASIQDILLNLEFSSVTAPISGRAGSIQVNVGNLVSTGSDTLVTINEIDPISVEFSVAERFMPQIRAILDTPDAVVDVFDNSTERKLASGKLDFMQNYVDRSTGMIGLSARFENASHRLWPGQFVRVVMRLERIADAVQVPAVAVQRGQNYPFVFVVGADQTVEMREVKVGEQRELDAVIEEGLAAGEVVVTDGVLRLTPGAPVIIHASLDDAVESALVQGGAAKGKANGEKANR
jgi:multidrug efflux system membrane fusion protein